MNENQGKDEYQSMDTVLSAVMVGGLAVMGVVMIVVQGVQSVVA